MYPNKSYIHSNINLWDSLNHSCNLFRLIEKQVLPLKWIKITLFITKVVVYRNWMRPMLLDFIKGLDIFQRQIKVKYRSFEECK